MLCQSIDPCLGLVHRRPEVAVELTSTVAGTEIKKFYSTKSSTILNFLKSNRQGWQYFVKFLHRQIILFHSQALNNPKSQWQSFPPTAQTGLPVQRRRWLTIRLKIMGYLLFCVHLSHDVLVHVVNNAMHMRHILNNERFECRVLVVLKDQIKIIRRGIGYDYRGVQTLEELLSSCPKSKLFQ